MKYGYKTSLCNQETQQVNFKSPIDCKCVTNPDWRKELGPRAAPSLRYDKQIGQQLYQYRYNMAVTCPLSNGAPMTPILE